jgi:hypothetical protein
MQISPHGTGMAGPKNDRKPRSRPLEFEARNLLAAGGYFVMHRNGSETPVNLMGVSDNEVLLVQVRRSRTPVSNVRDVRERFHADMDMIRKIGGTRFCKKELWVFSQPEGWHYYEVFPGGLMELDEP